MEQPDDRRGDPDVADLELVGLTVSPS